MSTDSVLPPLQLKGEIMDLEFTVDTDHRKRRRNRTTQSCLNCHTSKRKCDRKRPCQRCIQLGLTGLCVYEIDDPALRDDPTIDEATRLRNRIAELESLVRELRGKPHPRWADANFRDGDPSERWHSRAAKNNMQLRRRGRSDDVLERTNQEPRGLVSAAGAPIKIEPVTDISRPDLYCFSPSPPASYSTFHPDNPSSPPFERQNGHHYSNSLPSNGRSMPYSSPTSNQNMTYNHHHTDSSFQENGHVYPMNSAEQDKVFGNHFADSPSLAFFFHQLQSTLNSLRQYAQHPENTQCQLFRRIIELHDLMRGNDPDEASGSPYGTLPTPTESDILSSHSSSSTPFHGSSSASVSEWNAMASSRFNPYFPVSPTEQGLYSNIIT
ncbi:hypothetical protein F4604DRAFT_1793537 [Suillus subluteus]|nr:hypothetical protein F4604DRAFT_1793537 [Suillus subluteus]